MRKKQRKKRRGKRESVQALRSLDHRLGLIKGDIDMLDRVLGPEGGLRSDYDDRWIEGCREGMAIAHDLLLGRIRDLAIRSIFEGLPIRIRYYEGAEPTITDRSLFPPDQVLP